MGGTLDARGNVSFLPTNEFNFSCDPEAAEIVLQAFPAPVLVTWECCLNHAVPWSRYDDWMAAGSPRCHLMTAIRQHSRAFTTRFGADSAFNSLFKTFGGKET